MKPWKLPLSRSPSIDTYDLEPSSGPSSRRSSFDLGLEYPSSEQSPSLSRSPSITSLDNLPWNNDSYEPNQMPTSVITPSPSVTQLLVQSQNPSQRKNTRLPPQVNMMMDMYESKASYKEQMRYVFDNVYNPMGWTSVEENPEITDIFGAYIDNYTIGDLSKFVFANMPSSIEFTYCEYDMMNKFKKDLLMASLIDDPLSENVDVNCTLLLTKIEAIQKSLSTDQKRKTLTDDSSNHKYQKTHEYVEVFEYQDSDEDSKSEPYNSEPYTGGASPYTRISKYNKFVQWNTLFGEFLHDLTEKRINQSDYTSFKGDTGAEGMITKGWEKVIAPPVIDSGRDYDYIRAKALYDSQPLNEPKYVEETIRVIQKVNPEFLSDTDYTPLTTMSTSYYNEPINATSQSGLQTELREIYDNIHKFFKGAVVIPRKKTKGTVAGASTFCYVFYVLNSKTQTDKYNTIQLQMTDMNIDQNAVNARLLYPDLIEGDPLSYFYSLFSSTRQPLSERGTQVELSTDKIDEAATIISVETPTLETYAKGLDPITRSQSIGLTQIDIQLHNTDNGTEVVLPIQKSVITQTPEVMESFSKIVSTHISNADYLTRYVKSINEYFRFNSTTGEYTYTYDANKTDENDNFSKLLLESFIGKATIDSMNELLNIWFTSDANITYFKQKLSTNDSVDSYDTIRFEKLLTDSMELADEAHQPTPFFNFTLGSTTVENVAHTLVELTSLLKASNYLNIVTRNITKEQLNALIGLIYDSSNKIDPALCSFVVYLLNNLQHLHNELQELEIVNLILMFVAFSKSCGDELQRLTCEKINNELEVPVFILTRDRIFVAKCLAETTPCVSTIIIDQLQDPADGDVSIEGGQKGGARENSTQTRGGVLITNISALKSTPKTPQDIIQEKYIKGLTLYNELNKRIYLKLNGPTTTKLQNILIKTSIDENIDFKKEQGEISSLISNAFSDESIDETAAVSDITSQIEQLYIQNARLSEFLDILEFYNINLQSDPTFIQGLIDAEISILALRLLSSSQKQFLLSIGEPKPSNTKGLFKTIQVSAGNADVASTLIEIYTTATTVILDQIQKSREKLLLYHTTSQNIEISEMVTESETDILYIELSESNNLASVTTYYKDIENAIETQYSTFMQQNIKKLELEEIAVNRSGQRSRSSSTASLVSITNDIETKIEEYEDELSNLVSTLSAENTNINADIEKINQVLTGLNSDPNQNYKAFDDQINEIIKKYDSKKPILSSITDFFKGTKKKLMDKTSKALKLIEKYATKKRKEFESLIAKRKENIEKLKAKETKAPPKQTANTLSTIIKKAKDSFQTITQKIYNRSTSMGPPTSRSKSSFFNRGGKRHSKKRNTLFKKGQHNKHSNRRIRKLGILTRKRRNKQPQISHLKLETIPHTKPLRKTRRHTRQ